jgi:hypothetical protein
VTEEKLAFAKTAPAMLLAAIYGLTLQDWVAIVTIVYVLLQAGLLVPKYWRMMRGRRRGENTQGEP